MGIAAHLMLLHKRAPRSDDDSTRDSRRAEAWLESACTLEQVHEEHERIAPSGSGLPGDNHPLRTKGRSSKGSVTSLPSAVAAAISAAPVTIRAAEPPPQGRQQSVAL